MKKAPFFLACASLNKFTISMGPISVMIDIFLGGSVWSQDLSRPVQRKLVALLCFQLLEAEGRIRAVKTARSLGERALIELLLSHQNSAHLSSNLWSAVRARGCQFLGPGESVRSNFCYLAAGQRNIAQG